MDHFEERRDMPDVGADDLGELYRTQHLAMVRLATLLVDDVHTAEDVVHDAFAGLQSRWSALRDPQAATAYLRRAVVNRARSVLRRRRTARVHQPPPDVPLAGADDAVLLAEEHREVLDALARLPRRQREVLVLRYWSELGEADIARTLGIGPGTVKSSLSRGLDRLELLLAPDTPVTASVTTPSAFVRRPR